VSGDGLLGSLSLVSLLSLCCIGFGGLAGGAVVAGGGASASAFTTGVTSARGALITGVVTFATVFVAAAVIRWRLNLGASDD
jgi:hypothetical protein